MATETERREAQIGAMHVARMSELATMEVDNEWASEQRQEMGEWYDALLKHFEETDQKPLADAIRYGLEEHELNITGKVYRDGIELIGEDLADAKTDWYRIVRPDKPRLTLIPGGD